MLGIALNPPQTLLSMRNVSRRLRWSCPWAGESVRLWSQHKYIEGSTAGNTYESQVWLDDAEVREQRLGLVVLDGRVYDDIVTWNPVDGCGDTVLVAGLQRVEDPQHLSSVAAGGGGVREDQANGLLGVDDEHLWYEHEVSACLMDAPYNEVYQPIGS